MSLDLPKLQQIAKPTTEKIDLPEFGEGVCLYIRKFSAADRSRFWDYVNDGSKKSDLQARLLALVLVDEKGEQLAPGEDGYIEIGKLSTELVDKLFKEASRINGLTIAAQEEARKNSETTPSEDGSIA